MTASPSSAHAAAPVSGQHDADGQDDPDAAVPLSRVPVGLPCTVAAIDGPLRQELEREGLLPGRVVVVATRTPLGGPLVVLLGRARLAISTDVAERVLTVIQERAGDLP